MGRNRTPTDILEAKGSFLTHKNRQRPNEPVVDRPIGDPPKHFAKEEKKVWKAMVKEACPGVLMESDRRVFAVLVRLATKFELNQDMKVMETNQLIALSSKFAMNPADRSKVAVEKPKQSALAAFMSKRMTNKDTHIQ